MALVSRLVTSGRLSLRLVRLRVLLLRSPGTDLPRPRLVKNHQLAVESPPLVVEKQSLVVRNRPRVAESPLVRGNLRLRENPHPADAVDKICQMRAQQRKVMLPG